MFINASYSLQNAQIKSYDNNNNNNKDNKEHLFDRHSCPEHT
jgi:hypothetical protein